MLKIKYSACCENRLITLAGWLACGLSPGMVIYLQGTLGAGKTTFARALIKSLGYAGKVKSPTYTLVEPYELPQFTVYHFDLYRLADAEELELIGLRDYLNQAGLCLFEWPEKALNVLPPADISIELSTSVTGSERNIEIIAHTEQGRTALESLTHE